MKIPVFVSCRDVGRLSHEQQGVHEALVGILHDMNLQARTVGRSDYAIDSPLREVLVLARHCAGGLILGFDEGKGSHTPWTQLESGIMYALGLPLLVFREGSVQGGIFDLGTTSLFVQRMPSLDEVTTSKDLLREVFQTWRSRVQKTYYDE